MTNQTSLPSKENKRYWEIDAVRGICLIGMIIFHVIFVLGLFKIISTDIWENLICKDIIEGTHFQYIHLGTSLFVFICGFSLILRQRRMENRTQKEYNIAVIKRGIQVILVGLLIALIASAAIYFFIKDGRYMMFNLLMMMGFSMIICLFFIKLKKWAFIPAIFLFILGLLITQIHGPLYLMPFGILPDNFIPRDYFPIIPWIGIMLLGFSVGSVLYPNGYRKFSVPKPNKFLKMLSTIGKYPLQIYVLHIPIIFLIVAPIAFICGIN